MKHTKGQLVKANEDEYGIFVGVKDKRASVAKFFSDNSLVTSKEAAKANVKLFIAASEMKELIQEFVDRCDKGEVRSTITYAKFQTLLNKLK